MQEEQKTQAPETNQPIANVATKEKMSKKQIIGITILSLIAVAGVAFGIFGMNSQNQEIERLKVQVTEASGQKTELETDQITITDPDGTTTEITDTVAPAVNTSEYIYVGEWGIKIKIPENLKDVSYTIENWNETNYAGTNLCVQGATTGHGDAIPTFIKYSVQGAYVCLGKNTKSISAENGGQGNQVFPVGEFYVIGPQGIVGDGSDQDWEIESVNTIRSMLEDTNNRSKI